MPRTGNGHQHTRSGFLVSVEDFKPWGVGNKEWEVGTFGTGNPT